jgi:hypothetical protein
MVKQSFASKNFNDEQLLNSNIQLLIDPGVPTDIVPDGFIRIGGTSLYFRVGGAWNEVGAGGGAAYRSIERTENTTVLLSGTDEERQFVTPTADMIMVLPLTGIDNESYFLIANDDPGSGFSVTVNADNVTQVLGTASGINFIHCAYTGTSWKLYA